MKNIDFASLDWQLLNTFLKIHEECSVSGAALRLGLQQSTVSHALGRLRAIFDDPLFVRSGQKMVPTERALALQPRVRTILDDLQGLADLRPFDPREEEMSFIVAANDLQRDLIFPSLLRDLTQEGISVAFEFIPSGHPAPGMMRDARCHLALTPFPPDTTDILQKAILHGRMMCFYDGSIRKPPRTWEEYCAADRLTVRFPDGGTSLRALTGIDTSRIRDAHVSVPNFNAMPAFLRGTNLLATEIDLMKRAALAEFDMAPLPKPSDPVTIFMTWHQRSTNDPAHIWLRDRIEETARRVMAANPEP
ncbi:LysR family transcriptional regulator [Tropicimonas sp. TH_r6]|uniref:LysR family transcriptional regulator n=1 Tax=Tropicimonas sp. TH_r6 TaxID=3082085 RepID=UPI002953D7D5|nr:LysR family transcriptional regulator [Tropicimonas sp. TH_r6]MDV7143430.1 LysR family transcriptional regulator [Tropicimonas sp. TH_r6]